MYTHRNIIEFFRNIIHCCAALIPWIAHLFGVPKTLVLLCTLSFLYTISELSHLRYPHVYSVIDLADRNQSHRFFILGPLSLALGVSIVLYFFSSTIATAAIFSLAFGDSISSVIGVRFGKHRLPYGHKSWEGSLSCFLAVAGMLMFLGNDPWIAVLVAGIATLAESTPVRDLDNILVPTCTAISLEIIGTYI